MRVQGRRRKRGHEEEEEGLQSLPTQVAAGSAVAIARGPYSGSHGRVLEPALTVAEGQQEEQAEAQPWLDELGSASSSAAAAARSSVGSAQPATRASSRTVVAPTRHEPESGLRQRGDSKRLTRVAEEEEEEEVEGEEGEEEGEEEEGISASGARHQELAFHSGRHG